MYQRSHNLTATTRKMMGSPYKRQWWLRYGIALLAAGAGCGSRLVVGEAWPATAVPFIFFYPMIALAAWVGGFWPAVVATVISAGLADWFFVTPIQSFFWEDPHTPEGQLLFSFAVVCLLIAGVVERLHWANARTQRLLATGQQAQEEITDLRDRLAAELNDMKRLHEISTRFVLHGDLKSLLQEIVQAAIGISGAARGHVQLTDHSGRLKVAAQVGFDSALISAFDSAVAGSTSARWGHRIVVKDLGATPNEIEPRLAELLLHAGIRAMQTTPLVSRDGLWLGVLTIHFHTPQASEERQLRIIDLLARQAADFLERTRAEAALRVAKEELARTNIQLERKVQERTARLRETVNELEQFSYTISHDLRAPLRAIGAFSNLLLEEHATDLNEQAKIYLERIDRAAARMDRLIQDVLSLSRVARQEVRLSRISLESFLQELTQHHPVFQTKQGHLVIDPPLLGVLANEALLTQCLSNLVGNAMKFVAPNRKPRVRLWTERHEGRVRVCVADNGIGIEEASLGRIWGIFERLHQEGYDGTGIGLSIVKKAVERMNGTVGVESRVGEGSTFWFELPEAREDLLTPATADGPAA